MTYHEAVERLDILCKGKSHTMTRHVYRSGHIGLDASVYYKDAAERDGLGVIVSVHKDFDDWQQVIDYIEAEMKERGLL